MIGTFTLIAALLIPSTQEKVNFSPRFETGRSSTYTFEFGGKTNQGDVLAKAEILITFGDKKDTKTSAVVTTKSMSMTMNGQEQSSSLPGDLSVTLDEHGVPESASLQGSGGMVLIPMVFAYLPNKELAPGDTFDIAWKTESLSYKGLGTFEGLEDLSGKKLPKLKVKSRLEPSEGDAGDLDLHIWYDPQLGQVAKLEGTAKVGNDSFNFTYTRKS